MRAGAKSLLEKYEIGVDPDDGVGLLPNDLKKMVQIVKAVSLEPKISDFGRADFFADGSAGSRRAAT